MAPFDHSIQVYRAKPYSCIRCCAGLACARCRAWAETSPGLCIMCQAAAGHGQQALPHAAPCPQHHRSSAHTSGSMQGYPWLFLRLDGCARRTQGPRANGHSAHAASGASFRMRACLTSCQWIQIRQQLITGIAPPVMSMTVSTHRQACTRSNPSTLSTDRCRRRFSCGCDVTMCIMCGGVDAMSPEGLCAAVPWSCHCVEYARAGGSAPEQPCPACQSPPRSAAALAAATGRTAVQSAVHGSTCRCRSCNLCGFHHVLARHRRVTREPFAALNAAASP